MRSANPTQPMPACCVRPRLTFFKASHSSAGGWIALPTSPPTSPTTVCSTMSMKRACSDLIQALAELGIIGTTVIPLLCAGLLVRYLCGGPSIRLTNHLLAGCFCLALLAFVDSPFMSPAVFLSFFVLFFSAMRWADLSRHKIDEVDAKVALVTHRVTVKSVSPPIRRPTNSNRS